MNEVFISYSRKDEQFVSRLVADLEREGRAVFYDRKLKPGQDYEKILSQELERAKFVLVILSPDSLSSSEVSREVRTGLRRERDGLTTVVPLLITQCDQKSLTALIGKKIYANFTVTYKDGFEELSSILGKSKAIRGGGRKRMGLKQTGIGAAIITGIVGIATAYWQYGRRPEPPPDPEIQYLGRVMDSGDGHKIAKAKISVETSAGPPQVYYSDTEGVFYLKLPASIGSAKIWVEADGYESISRTVSLSRTGTEEVHLARIKPTPTPTPTPPKRKDPQRRIDQILKSEPSSKPN